MTLGVVRGKRRLMNPQWAVFLNIMSRFEIGKWVLTA